MKIKTKYIIFLCLCLFCYLNVVGQGVKADKYEGRILKALSTWNNPLVSWGHVGQIALDSLVINHSNETIAFYFKKPLSYIPWRSEKVSVFKNSLSNKLKRKVRHYKPLVYSNGYEISQLVPNWKRPVKEIDLSRLSPSTDKPIFKIQEGVEVHNQGLSHNYIALWHSHGWYYESKLDRWEWQRARLYGSVEDISPMLYVLPYIVPMLENSGATVFLPRDRSFQKHEVIVDDNRSTLGSELMLNNDLEWFAQEGFLMIDTLYPGDNPFQLGSSQLTQANGHVATFKPEIFESGMYAVYVSYQQSESNAAKVKYTINHSGGTSSYLLNQTMGGGTWVYLGEFHFNKGNSALVVVSGQGQISIDAVRFGGGMGNVARRPANEIMPNQWSLKTFQTTHKKEEVNPDDFSWKTSQRPRYMEAARYWLQYAGLPDTLVFNLNDEKNDYNDDYQSRGEWVNYLMGAPNGPIKNRNALGLKIPIDLAFAFHTDAGVTPNDSVIGTLGIYSAEREEGVFPNGQAKLASRDLTDMIQTQLVDDIRALYNENWTRRGLWDKQYSEAWRPNVPTMLLELLSHQNVADMKFGLDPHFRFDVSRAVYKGMLKFLAVQERRDYVVQPLPADHMAISKVSGGYELSWQPVSDPLEETAVPTKYKVYRRIGNNGFDNGVVVTDIKYTLPKQLNGELVSYKVTALNDGGESMPSEILSLGIVNDNAETILVVNAFDRISAPAFIDENNFAGVAWWQDQGVPYKYEYAYTGHQYDFNRQSEWLDDDSPGWGASYGDQEARIIKGNSFDNVIVHGQSIMKAGYSFVSVSDEVFENPAYDASAYKAIDVILGEEKTTLSYKGKGPRYKIYTTAFMDKIREVTANHQHVFMSGAYVGSDFMLTNDTIAEKFASEVLHFIWRTNHAVKNGGVYTSDYAKSIESREFGFNTGYLPEIYTVEAPDAIEPSGKNVVTAFRYKENNASAGTMYNEDYKTVILGFPFETIETESDRDVLMKDILDFFIKE